LKRRAIYLLSVPAAAALLFLALVKSGLLWSLARPALHKDVINRYAAEFKFDPLFVMALVKTESGFSRHARSHRGAVGLMQLMPETGMEMAAREGLTISQEDLAVPEVNIRLGVRYLSVLRAEFQTDITALLAAYNAGPTNARAWRKGDALSLEDIPFPETRQFVRRVMTTHVWLKRFQKVKNAFA
jgi:soluble lytic murein transglycosylase